MVNFKNASLASRIVSSILKNLLKRQGVGDEIESIDSDIREDMDRDLNALVYKQLQDDKKNDQALEDKINDLKTLVTELEPGTSGWFAHYYALQDKETGAEYNTTHYGKLLCRIKEAVKSEDKQEGL